MGPIPPGQRGLGGPWGSFCHFLSSCFKVLSFCWLLLGLFGPPGISGTRQVWTNAGPRICLGKDLAYLQMKSIAAAVLLRHRLTVAKGHRVEQKMSLTLFMKYGLKVDLHPRELRPILGKLISKDYDVNCPDKGVIRNGNYHGGSPGEDN